MSKHERSLEIGICVEELSTPVAPCFLRFPQHKRLGFLQRPKATTSGTTPDQSTMLWSKETAVANFRVQAIKGTTSIAYCEVAYKTFQVKHAALREAYKDAFDECLRYAEKHGLRLLLCTRFDTVDKSDHTLAAMKLKKLQTEFNKANRDRLARIVPSTILVIDRKALAFMVKLVLRVVPPKNPYRVMKSFTDTKQTVKLLLGLANIKFSSRAL
jgi:hypothetical protein